MKKLICMLLALCFVFALAACGATEEKTTETETATTEVKTTETETTEATESNTKPGPGTDEVDTTVLYTIKVVDEGGNPVSAATIAQICDEACVPVKLTDGVGEKKLEPNEKYHVNLTVMPEGYEYASGETEYYFDAENVCVITLKAVG